MSSRYCAQHEQSKSGIFMFLVLFLYQPLCHPHYPTDKNQSLMTSQVPNLMAEFLLLLRTESSTASTQPGSAASVLSFAFSSSAREPAARDAGRGHPVVADPIPSPATAGPDRLQQPSPSAAVSGLTCETAAGVRACLWTGRPACLPLDHAGLCRHEPQEDSVLKGAPIMCCQCQGKLFPSPRVVTGFTPARGSGGFSGGHPGPLPLRLLLLCLWSVCGGHLPQVSSRLAAQGPVLNRGRRFRTRLQPPAIAGPDDKAGESLWSWMFYLLASWTAGGRVRFLPGLRRPIVDDECVADQTQGTQFQHDSPAWASAGPGCSLWGCAPSAVLCSSFLSHLPDPANAWGPGGCLIHPGVTGTLIVLFVSNKVQTVSSPPA